MYRIPKDASYVTLRNQNRMLYANYRIQQNNVDDGCQLRIALQNGGVADADIVPKLLEGARETTVEELDRILASERCPIAATVIPDDLPNPGIGGSMLFSASLGSTGTQVTYPNNAALAIGQQAFTIEWFQFATSYDDFPRPFSIGTYTNSSVSIAVSYEGGDILFWNGTTPVFTGAAAPTLNTWAHVAVVGTGTGANNVSIYVNGTRVYNGTISYNFTNTTTALAIGNETIPDSLASFVGQITNFRWVKGTAVYTGTSITVPTAPLAAISGTQLLLLASDSAGLLVDSSSANRTPSNTGVTFSSTNPF
jgi:hypothetical protein